MTDFVLPNFVDDYRDKKPTQEELDWLNSIDPKDWKWKEISLERCKMFGVPSFLKDGW